ncbi:hypothetical protein BT67DRAFT_115875 [Trichocladium antarcticum]|uniref:Uncharacterized protein n=1 Tax=Trichocladium antarcticum TaxID=1450529 RepID=A0AAN6ZH25_9PEZI|nr:hypothetical protein BT67DRAFT_115875 [Trichocladium antarcticum]
MTFLINNPPPRHRAYGQAAETTSCAAARCCWVDVSVESSRVRFKHERCEQALVDSGGREALRQVQSAPEKRNPGRVEEEVVVWDTAGRVEGSLEVVGQPLGLFEDGIHAGRLVDVPVLGRLNTGAEGPRTRSCWRKCRRSSSHCSCLTLQLALCKLTGAKRKRTRRRIIWNA